MSHHERPTCRGCRLLRVELARLQRESESRATADAQRCLAMYDHMERLARLNLALTQQHKSAMALTKETKKPYDGIVEFPPPGHGDKSHASVEHRLQQLQATIIQQAREIERLERQLKSSVPMLTLDGAQLVDKRGNEDESDDNQSLDQECPQTRQRRGLEKLPLTSLHAQLRARDATIHRLEHHVAELTAALDASREKKSHATAQYQHVTKNQQTQLKKCAARIEELTRVQRETERETDGLKAYVGVLEKKLLAKKGAAVERAFLLDRDVDDGRRCGRLFELPR